MTDNARTNNITHNFLGTLDGLRVIDTKNGQFARFKITRPGDKRDQYCKMQHKTLRRYQEDLANGVFGERKLDFGGYYTKETYNNKDGEVKEGSVFVVLSIRPAKTREEISALAQAKRERLAAENQETPVEDDMPF